MGLLGALAADPLPFYRQSAAEGFLDHLATDAVTGQAGAVCRGLKLQGQATADAAGRLIGLQQVAVGIEHHDAVRQRPEDRLQIGPVAFGFIGQTFYVQGVAGSGQQFVRMDRFCQIVAGPQSHRFGGGLHFGLAGDQHHLQQGGADPQQFEQVNTGGAAQLDIHKGDVAGPFIQKLQGTTG